MSRPSWDEYFLVKAKHAATRSTCLGRQVGAVIVKDKHVIADGYNGVPSGIEHCADRSWCFDAPNCIQSKKPSLAIHAEANAIAQVAKMGGVSTLGAALYCTVEPCIDCLKFAIGAGIKEIYFEEATGSDAEVKNAILPDGVVFKQISK